MQPDGFGGRSLAHRAYYFGREIEPWAEYRGALAAYEINFFTGCQCIQTVFDLVYRQAVTIGNLPDGFGDCRAI